MEFRNVVHIYQTPHLTSCHLSTMHYTWQILLFKNFVAVRHSNLKAISYIFSHFVHLELPDAASATGLRIFIVASWNNGIFFRCAFSWEENCHVPSAWSSCLLVSQYKEDGPSRTGQLLSISPHIWLPGNRPQYVHFQLTDKGIWMQNPLIPRKNTKQKH